MSKTDITRWFKAFRESYRKIVESKFPKRKDTFPFYQPVDISVYLVDDAKSIFPQVIALFCLGFSAEYPASDLVLASTKKIEWPEDLDEMEETEQRIQYETKWHEVFYEDYKLPVISHEVFHSDFFLSRPEDIAMVFVQKHLIHDEQKERFEEFQRLSKIRRSIIGVSGLQELCSKLAGMRAMADLDRASILCKIFWTLGFEVINLEELKEQSRFRDLQTIPHVDLLALLPSEKILIAVDEGEMNKERWYKLFSLDATLKKIRFLGEKKDWEVSFVAIGRKSSGIEYLEGNVQVISVDYLQRILQEYFESRRWAPALDAIRKIIGYQIDFFRLRI